MKDKHFPDQFLKEKREKKGTFSVPVDEWYTGGKHSPLVCRINAMSDP